jgi:hypothetical protein
VVLETFHTNSEYRNQIAFFFLLLLFLSGVRVSSLGTAATTGLLCQQHMIDDGDCGVTGGMKIGRGNRSTRRKPCPSATLSTTNHT